MYRMYSLFLLIYIISLPLSFSIAKDKKHKNKNNIVFFNKKIFKDSPLEEKYIIATKLYEENKYTLAIKYLDEIIPLMVFDKKIKNARLMQAYCSFNIEDYIASIYQFEELFDDYKADEIGEEALYMQGFSMYKLSFSLKADESYTEESIFILKKYISLYPEGKFIEEAKKYLREMSVKIYNKFYEISRTYYLLEYYKAAAIELKRIISNPPTKALELKSKWLMLKILYNDAYYSKDDWQKWIRAQKYCLDFIFEYPKSKYTKEVDKLFKRLKKIINN